MKCAHIANFGRVFQALDCFSDVNDIPFSSLFLRIWSIAWQGIQYPRPFSRFQICFSYRLQLTNEKKVIQINLLIEIANFRLIEIHDF